MASKYSPLPELIDGPDGYKILPPGRHTCSFSQFESRFVTERIVDHARRSRILEDFLAYRDQQLRCGLVVTSYWIDGSFTSDKVDPGDIDITSLVDGNASRPAGDFASWLNPKDYWKVFVHPHVERTLLVDGFAIVKYPDAAPQELLDNYLKMRGYWDDWWQRSRNTGDRESKGYVEVRF